MSDDTAITHSPHRRPGSTYLLVLGSSMAIAVIGLSAIVGTRTARRFSEGTADLAQARLYARSAVEIGFLKVTTDPDWRTNYTSGLWSTNQPLGHGTYDLYGTDPSDGDLANADTDPLLLVGAGREGSAQYKLEVFMTAVVPPLNCLEVALCAGNDILLADAAIQTDRSISANNDVVTSGVSLVLADVEAVNNVSGVGYQGLQASGAEPRDLPDPNTAFDYYVTNGTPIDVNLLVHNGHYDLKDVVLSPVTNPFGAPNSEGIYVLDMRGGELRIKDLRIVGTLVLLDPAATSKVSNAVNWTPAVPNYPALLVRGSMVIRMTSNVLDESARGVNFNPPGVPYAGVEDLDLLDSYPSKLDGLVYVSGDLDVSTRLDVNGIVVVGNTLTGTDILRLTYDPVSYDTPPPGFTEPPRMVVTPGSWRHVAE